MPVPVPPPPDTDAAAQAAAEEARRKAAEAAAQQAAASGQPPPPPNQPYQMSDQPGGIYGTSTTGATSGEKAAGQAVGVWKSADPITSAIVGGVDKVGSDIDVGDIPNPFATAKMGTYDPNPGRFNLMQQGAVPLANAYTEQQQGAQAQAAAGMNIGLQQQAQQQALGAQAQQGMAGLATGAQNLGASNVRTFGATAQDFARQGTNAQFRAGTDVGYGESQALARQQLQDRAAALGLVGRQMQFAEQGPGPSAAQAQLQQGAEAAQLRNLSLARSGRGFGQNAAALRGAVSANADVQAQTNQQAAVLRAQEAANWRGQQLQAFGQAQQGLQGVGGQSLQARGLAGQEAQYQAGLSDQQRARNDALMAQYASLGLNAQQFGAQNQLGYSQLAGQNLAQGYQLGLGYNQLGQQAYGQGTQYNLGMNQLGQQYAGMGLKAYEDQLAASIAYENLRSGNIMQTQRYNADAATAQNQGILGAGMGLLGGVLSDEEEKTAIQPLSLAGQVQQTQDSYNAQREEAMKPKEKSGGLLAGILSDKNSKAEIQKLQTALDITGQQLEERNAEAQWMAQRLPKDVLEKAPPSSGLVFNARQSALDKRPTKAPPPRAPSAETRSIMPAVDWDELRGSRDEAVSGPRGPLAPRPQAQPRESAWLEDRASQYMERGLDYEEAEKRASIDSRLWEYEKARADQASGPMTFPLSTLSNTMQASRLPSTSQLEGEQPTGPGPTRGGSLQVAPKGEKPMPPTLVHPYDPDFERFWGVSDVAGDHWGPTQGEQDRYFTDEGVMSDEKKKTKVTDLEEKAAAIGKPSKGRFEDVTQEDEVRGAQARTMAPNRGFQDLTQDRDRQMGNLELMQGLSAMRPPEVDMSRAPAYSYEYKNPSAPGAAPGRQVGPMAQDLGHIPGVVKETPAGTKMVDSQRLTMANTAAIGQTQRENEDLRRRLEELKAQYASIMPSQGAFPGAR